MLTRIKRPFLLSIKNSDGLFRKDFQSLSLCAGNAQNCSQLFALYNICMTFATFCSGPEQLDIKDLASCIEEIFKPSTPHRKRALSFCFLICVNFEQIELAISTENQDKK